MKVVCVTGTPGTGKTTIAKKLAEKYSFHYLDVNKMIIKNKLVEGFDEARKTRVVDAKKLNKFLIKHINQLKANKKIKGIVIDSHLSHYLSKKYVNLVVVTKCDIGELNKRLKKRKYSQAKIKENLQAEIFNICYNEAFEGKHKIITIDATKGFNMSKIYH